MGSLRKLVYSLTVSLITLVQAPALCAQTPDKVMPLFATCTGRLSAVLEFQWLMQDPGADRTQSQRDAMADLLAAVTPPALRVRAMQLRIEAKVAAADVLARGRFAQNPGVAGRARARATELLAACTALLLS